MKSILKIFLIFVITTLFISGAMAACSIDLSNFTVELRSDQDGYANTIYAENNSEIDIKINFDIDYIGDQADCATNIGAKAEIFRWNNTTNDWVRIRTTTTKTQALEEDIFSFTWSNDFSISNSYDRYKVEGILQNGTTELDRKESYIDIENNTCSGIILRTTNFEIDEGRSKREYFYIENNTNKHFDVSNAEIYFTSSGVTSGSVDFPSRVNMRNTASISVNLNANNVSRDTTVTGRFRVSGYLDGTFCSINNIGEKTFDVKILDRGTTSPGTTTPSGVCADLQLITRDFEMNESSTAQEIFYLKNNSTKRFEILEVKTTSSGLDVESFYLEKYAHPNNLANIVVKTIAGNVTQNRLYENTIQVRGRFSDGTTCSFTNIGERSFITTVKDVSQNTTQTCEGFSINVANTVELQNAGTIPLTITNNTSRTANVYVESNLQVSPALITLPANSSITRELSVSVINRDGTITLRPDIFGCPTAGAIQVINVKNTASGELQSIIVNNRVETDQNSIKLIVEFDNPTNKLFTGIVSFSGARWISEDKLVTLAPGQNFVEMRLIPSGQNQSQTGKISFTSNGQTIEKDVTLTATNLLTGLFGFGSGIAGFGIFLIIVIIAILIVVYIIDYNNNQISQEDKEAWQK